MDTSSTVHVPSARCQHAACAVLCRHSKPSVASRVASSTVRIETSSYESICVYLLIQLLDCQVVCDSGSDSVIASEFARLLSSQLSPSPTLELVFCRHKSILLVRALDYRRGYFSGFAMRNREKSFSPCRAVRRYGAWASFTSFQSAHQGSNLGPSP